MIMAFIVECGTGCVIVDISSLKQIYMIYTTCKKF